MSPAAVIARFVVVVLWTIALASGAAVFGEWFLRFQAGREASEGFVAARPRFDRIERAYQPFRVQHLHPQYLFFFPLDPAQRVALSNETVTLDPDGFRGGGPARANGRRLSFFLGGSAAFGFHASSDSTTIPGYLNQLQDEYFFVNAGVPSWNSTQEMFRLAFQIIDYKPALVVAYDGSNDADILREYHSKGLSYAVGAPESFERLAALVDDIRADTAERPASLLLPSLFPELTPAVLAPSGPVFPKAKLRALSGSEKIRFKGASRGTWRT